MVFISYLVLSAFQEQLRLEQELIGSVSRWMATWDQLDTPAPPDPSTALSTQISKSQCRAQHKRSTVELLVKGKMLGEAAKMFSQPHRFEKFTYTTPAYCDYCSHVLWGLVKTGERTVNMLTHTYSYKPLRKIKWPSAVTRLTAHFTCGLSDRMNCKHGREHGHVYHRMSLLRPGIIKQHKLHQRIHRWKGRLGIEIFRTILNQIFKHTQTNSESHEVSILRQTVRAMKFIVFQSRSLYVMCSCCISVVVV